MARSSKYQPVGNRQKKASQKRSRIQSLTKLSSLVSSIDAEEFKASLQDSGYFVAKLGCIREGAWHSQALQLSRTVIDALLTADSAVGPAKVRKKTWCTVINRHPQQRSRHHGREQLHYGDCSKRVQECMAHFALYVEAVLRKVHQSDECCSNLIVRLCPEQQMQLLRSFSDSHEQVLHLDLAKLDRSWTELGADLVLRNAFCDKSQIPPLSVIIPLHRPVDLTVVPGSHGLVWNSSCQNMNDYILSNTTTLTIQVGEMIFFRQDLVHAGAAYEEPNVRIHAYVDGENLRDDGLITVVDVSKRKRKRLH